MRLCAECRSKIWPYAIVILVASFSGFITWLTMSVTGASETAIRMVSACVFVGVGGLLLGYMLCCLRRHCRHDDHSHA